MLPHAFLLQISFYCLMTWIVIFYWYLLLCYFGLRALIRLVERLATNERLKAAIAKVVEEILHISNRALLSFNNHWPQLFWSLYLDYVIFSMHFRNRLLPDLDTFETNFVQAWLDYLSRIGVVVKVKIFASGESMIVPILSENQGGQPASDATTFEHLVMWYSWMRYKRGFGELLLPRQLFRVDKVKVRATPEDI